MTNASGSHNRRVLVTGAGSGIGAAIARRMASAGYQVVATVRQSRRAEEMQAASGIAIRYLALELTDERQIAAVAARIQAEGGLDILVNNAGFGVFGATEEVDSEEVSRQFAVNVLGPLALTRRLLPTLRSRRGHVIWIGSLAGRMSLPFQAHYSATKAAVASISDAMRMELAPHGVRVTCVEPSDFATSFTDSRRSARCAESVYARAHDRCLAEVERQERGAPGPDAVATVVQRLAEDANPPARRPVGTNARTICLLLNLLPSRWAERMIRGHYGL